MPLQTALFSLVSRIKSSFLGGLLVVALGVTGVVTYHAYRSSVEHKEIVQRVLHDYVTFAAFQLGGSTKTALYNCAKEWFQPVRDGLAPLSMAGVRPNACGAHETGRFEIDLNAARAPIAQGGITSAALAWVADTARTHPLIRYSNDVGFGFLEYAPADGPSNLIVYAAEMHDQRPTHIAGFISGSVLPYVVSETVAESHMLPPELTDSNADSSYFDVHLAAARHELKKATVASAFTTRSALGDDFGNIGLNIELKPAAIGRIVPGGLPKDRGLELLGLLALAAGLVLSSLVLLQRESQLAQMREGFVSSVSHELRTPLTQIRMFAEMLLLGRVRNETDRRRSLEIIDKEARRLSQLVENVLQVARSGHGGVRVNPSEARVAPIVRDAVEGFLVLAESRKIEFRLELQDDLVAPIDASAVKQIVVNMLDNAAKYGPAGQRVVVGLALFEERARLWVDDEGPGVPMRERSRVFEPFYRSTRDLDSATTGSGIGLAVVRELATLHGGSAWIEEAPQSKGARIVVEFPNAHIAVAEHVADWQVA